MPIYLFDVIFFLDEFDLLKLCKLMLIFLYQSLKNDFINFRNLYPGLPKYYILLLLYHNFNYFLKDLNH
jgi:hypothetical protein